MCIRDSWPVFALLGRFASPSLLWLSFTAELAPAGVSPDRSLLYNHYWDAIKRGVQTYVAERATASEGPWTQCYVGKLSNCTDTGLVSGTEYWYRVPAIGAAGPSAWSDRASKRAS